MHARLGVLEYGYTEAVSLLIEKGADINVKDNSGRMPLYYASTDGHTEVVNLLIEKKEKGAKIKKKKKATCRSARPPWRP